MTAKQVRHNIIGINSIIRLINVHSAHGAAIAKVRVFGGDLSRNVTNSGTNLLLQNVRGRSIRQNVILTGPNDVAPRARFRKRICVLARGRNKHGAPFFPKCGPRFCIQAASMANDVGTFASSSNNTTRVIVPNSHVGVAMRLVGPVTVRRNVHFTVHRNNHAINTNIISDVLGWLDFSGP